LINKSIILTSRLLNNMSHQLEPLPFSPNALEPHIDARTMEIHHGKHHQTYVDKLNAALDGQNGLQNLSALELISDLSKVSDNIRGAVRNNAGGHVNHSFFWKSLSPDGGGEPQGGLASAIDHAFGSFNQFKQDFTNAALTRFGSGWAWLIKNVDGSVSVTSSPNQDSPWMAGVSEVVGQPLIGLDVWEHAYYLNYQNRRPDYVSAFWNIVDWNRASSLFDS
jgi:Fe-Mn family superoxide dismutase